MLHHLADPAVVENLELVYKCVEDREKDFKMAAEIGTVKRCTPTVQCFFAKIVRANCNYRSDAGAKESAIDGGCRSN